MIKIDTLDVNDSDAVGSLHLKEDEYLFRDYRTRTGFLSKLTQKNEIPIAFRNKCQNYGGKCFIVNNTYQKGWQLIGTRDGYSRSWAKVLSPDGYEFEVHLNTLVNNDMVGWTLINNEFQGEFKFDPKLKRLIKK